jgi:hypothetical protein
MSSRSAGRWAKSLVPTAMSLETRIDWVGNSIRILVRSLTKRGYQFERPAEVFPGPERATAGAIARIEREIGHLPLALKLFWQRIGSVDLCGSHADWDGCDYPDPLIVYPPSVAIGELVDFLADRDERLRCNFPYLVPIAPDSYHKAHVSGGMWYNISVPAVADDPPLNDEWHGTTFVSYLELAVRWAGLPGLSVCPGHTWPIVELVGGLAEGS